MLSCTDLVDLIQTSAPEPADRIAFDLHEFCTKLPAEFFSRGTSLEELSDWPAEDRDEIFAHRSPPEISALLGRRFLQGYESLLDTLPLNPSVRAVLDNPAPDSSGGHAGPPDVFDCS